MCKKLAITLLLVFGTVAFFRSERGRELISEWKSKCCSSDSKDSREISRLEREIAKIRGSLKRLAREDDQDIDRLAKKEQELDKLQVERITPLEKQAVTKKQEVLALRKELKDAVGFVKIGEKKFKVEDVKERLALVFHGYLRDVEELTSLRAKEEEIQKTIQAADRMMLSKRKQRQELEIEVLKLETEVFRMRREQMEKQTFVVKDGEYSKIRSRINQVKDRIDLQNRKQRLREKYFGTTPTTKPVSVKPAKDLLKEIDEHFGKQ